MALLERQRLSLFQKIRALHGWESGSEKHTNAKETQHLIWDGLKKFADQNQVCEINANTGKIIANRNN